MITITFCVSLSDKHFFPLSAVFNKRPPSTKSLDSENDIQGMDIDIEETD